MRINNIYAENYRGIRKIDVDFKSNFTILCGENGIGKSTVLFAIANSFGQFYQSNLRVSESAQLKLNFTGRDNKNHSVGLGKGSYRPQSNVCSNLNMYAPFLNEDGKSENIYIDNVEQLISPLFIGPYRNVVYKKISGMTAEGSITENRKKCISSSASALSMGELPDIKQWMINRYFIIDKDWALTERYNWESILSSLSSSLIFGGALSFDNIERDLEPSFIVNGNKVYLEELSSGFKSVISILFSIVEWIEGTNESEDAKIDVAKGTVLIDEIDAHLHPSWQTKIKKVLENTFPNIQFIVTTHSPHVISSGDENEVLILSNNNGELSAKVVSASLEFWKTDNIYRDIMSFETLYDEKVNDLIDKVEDLIDGQHFSEAKEIVDIYASQSHPEDNTPKALIRRINNVMKKEGF
ncbi:AAA family ATPase [Escherichia coli]|nr:AAA family ATPase [Escherichia coli]EGL0726127.1 AAA family ATPase [Escherichia coli]EGL0971880.1 AAA family ATPase [Escherichia coli]HEI2239333.1 AAA family ATPase [Escherichia coli]